MIDERLGAMALADKLLDEPMADPDDDLRVLARQFLRTEDLAERYRWLAADADRAAQLLSDAYQDWDTDVEWGPYLNGRIDEARAAKSDALPLASGWCPKCGCGKTDPDGRVVFAHLLGCPTLNSNAGQS